MVRACKIQIFWSSEAPAKRLPLGRMMGMMRDAGMRTQRELYWMRIENLDWENRLTFVPDSKTAEGRRLVPLPASKYPHSHAKLPCATHRVTPPHRGKGVKHRGALDGSRPGALSLEAHM